MKNFEIIIEQSKCIILSTSYINPLSDLNLIENELKQKNYKGEVIFDLLLTNGKSENRFLEAKYNYGFDQSSFIILENTYPWLLKLSKNFYESNLNLIDNSILTTLQKFLLIKGKFL